MHRYRNDIWMHGVCSSWHVWLEIRENLGGSREDDFTIFNQKEIADLCAVSKTMAGKYIDRGIAVGVWTRDEVSRGFAKGKLRRQLKQTQPPIRPLAFGDDDEGDEMPVVNPL